MSKYVLGREPFFVAISQINCAALQNYKKLYFLSKLLSSRLETPTVNPHFILRAPHESQITLEITHQGPFSLQPSG